jgi:hypothetical protein
MACRAGCPTQDHKSWGECLRAANFRVLYCRSHVGIDATREKKWDAELQSYRDARAQGIQPAGTTTAKIRQAVDISDKTGRAFDANNPLASLA